ncbi:MAG: GNAT family N-acetyltransferase, partial [Pseudomonadota bacterium]
PALQRSGIGTALIEAGMTQLRARSEHPVLFVLGHMDYYPRFGFSAARARDFVSPYSGDSFGDAFMAMDLQNNAPRQARLRFPKAFS